MSTYRVFANTADSRPRPAAAGTEAPAVELRNVRKQYVGGVDALANINVRICAGEQVAVVGPSGSGKTTMLHVMGTLERPSDGEVWIAGREISKLTDREVASLRARAIGFVFQQFFLLDSLTALENVGLGLLYQDIGARERRARATETLARVGLARRIAHRPSELSGGERQRVAIARAIIGGPQLLFADEPTGNLDSHTGAQILDLLQQLGREAVTLIVITHDHEIARRLPRQITMRDGQVASEEVAR
jgi:putative ABC transport system ATP-binding protein